MTPRESDTWAQETAYKARDQAEIWYNTSRVLTGLGIWYPFIGNQIQAGHFM